LNIFNGFVARFKDGKNSGAGPKKEEQGCLLQEKKKGGRTVRLNCGGVINEFSLIGLLAAKERGKRGLSWGGNFHSR